MHLTSSSAYVEIACDESGFSGTNLLDPASPVITHASVDLAVPEAAELVAALHSRLRRRGSSEYKSNLLLRPAPRPALEWFLTTLRGHAHVQVIDKTSYVAGRVIELLVDEPSYGDGTRLGRDHRETVAGLRDRTDFLDAFLVLARTKRLRLLDHAVIDRFLALLPTEVPVLRAVTRARVEEVLLRLIEDDPTIPPPLEPMVPALADTVLFWSAGFRSVAVVHDEQSALTRHRVARLGNYLAEAVSPAPPPLLGLQQVDSRDDPRVQTADFLAGIARWVATDPTVVPGLTDLLDPYLPV